MQTPDAPNASHAPSDNNRKPRWPWVVVVCLVIVVIVTAINESRRGARADAASTPTPTVQRVRTPTPTPRPSTMQVRYVVTGPGAVAITYTNAQGGTEQQSGRIRGDAWNARFTARPGTHVYVSVQNREDHGEVRCQIEIDGRVWRESVSQGGYTIATCSGIVGSD